MANRTQLGLDMEEAMTQALGMSQIKTLTMGRITVQGTQAEIDAILRKFFWGNKNG